jgi:hypothetical protein
MRIGRGKRSTWKNPAWLPHCERQIQYDLTWDRNWPGPCGKPAINHLSYGTTHYSVLRFCYSLIYFWSTSAPLCFMWIITNINTPLPSESLHTHLSTSPDLIWYYVTFVLETALWSSLRTPLELFNCLWTINKLHDQGLWKDKNSEIEFPQTMNQYKQEGDSG